MLDKWEEDLQMNDKLDTELDLPNGVRVHRLACNDNGLIDVVLGSALVSTSPGLLPSSPSISDTVDDTLYPSDLPHTPDRPYWDSPYPKIPSRLLRPHRSEGDATSTTTDSSRHRQVSRKLSYCQSDASVSPTPPRTPPPRERWVDTLGPSSRFLYQRTSGSKVYRRVSDDDDPVRERTSMWSHAPQTSPTRITDPSLYMTSSFFKDAETTNLEEEIDSHEESLLDLTWAPKEGKHRSRCRTPSPARPMSGSLLDVHSPTPSSNFGPPRINDPMFENVSNDPCPSLPSTPSRSRGRRGTRRPGRAYANMAWRT
jgi:hypothetical protein